MITGLIEGDATGLTGDARDRIMRYGSEGEKPGLETASATRDESV